MATIEIEITDDMRMHIMHAKRLSVNLPDGWCLTPKTNTDEMYAAFHSGCIEPQCVGLQLELRDKFRMRYEQMMKAIPEMSVSIGYTVRSDNARRHS